jgi:hypothetical protein
LEKIKNENIKEIMGVKGKPDIIDIIEKKRLQWSGHVKRMPEERIPKLILEWVQAERRKRGYHRKTWMEGVHAAMTARKHLINTSIRRQRKTFFATAICHSKFVYPYLNP